MSFTADRKRVRRTKTNRVRVVQTGPRYTTLPEYTVKNVFFFFYRFVFRFEPNTAMAGTLASDPTDFVVIEQSSSVCRSRSIWTLSTARPRTTVATGRRRRSARGRNRRRSRRTSGRCCWTWNGTSRTWRRRSRTAGGRADGRTTSAAVTTTTAAASAERTRKGCSGTARSARTETWP